NASPYDWHERSPRDGDNLYLASIVAIHARTGEMAWYYQQVPRPPAVVSAPMPQPPALVATPAEIARGAVLYNRFCGRCHFFGRAVLPDLRRMTPATHALFADIVLRGAFAAKGMGRFDDVLSAADVQALHAYIVSEAQRAYTAEQQAVTMGGGAAR
ncbi:MAG: c-type cytochrome, partial [Burkholderiales bacterium]|nr:c-type cytochrome [Burkholderiales bacterium]